MAGGFKRPVSKLRDRNKKVVKILRNVSVGILLGSGIMFLGCSIYSNVIDYQHIVKYGTGQTKDIQNKIERVRKTMFNINNDNHKNFFSDKDEYWPFFNIGNEIEGSSLRDDINKKDKKSISMQISGFLRWYTVIALIWWVVCLILVAFHKSVFRRRMVAISLFIAFLYILLMCLGVILLGKFPKPLKILGYKAVNVSLKNQICVQALNLTIFDQWPAEGDGISQFVVTIKKQHTLNAVKNQLYILAIAINSAYTVYLDRLAALGRPSEVTDIQTEHKVKTLMDKFLSVSEKDDI